MAKKNIGIGSTFGRWVVIGDKIKDEKGYVRWLCRCSCEKGTERYVLERSLVYGGSLSCGCLRKETISSKVGNNLKGKTFGELRVIRKSDNQNRNGGIWWVCECSCGNIYEVPATLLVTGRKTHCPSKVHGRNYFSKDITNKTFGRLKALYPTDKRDSSGSVIWHCRCSCNNEIDVSYNTLVYSNIKSCGCQKKEHDKKMPGFLEHIDGTSIDAIKSKKVPVDNTTGCKGVYLIKGKYVAKIVFQQKQYYLGTYESLDDAVKARKEAEKNIFDSSVEYYDRWKSKSEADPEWGKNNPPKFRVYKDTGGSLKIMFSPEI